MYNLWINNQVYRSLFPAFRKTRDLLQRVIIFVLHMMSLSVKTEVHV